MTQKWIDPAHIVQGIKVALGAMAAILLANLLHLSYGSTAGIITVLGILGTKKETLIIAGFKLISFVAALLIALVCYSVFGYTLLGFSMYLFVFAVVCYTFGWTYSIAMISVLISHFLAEKSMAMPVLINEVLLFIIGTVFSIVVNLHLKADDQKMSLLLEEIDRNMKRLLSLTGRMLDDSDQDGSVAQGLEKLKQDIQSVESFALNNANNQFFKQSHYEIHYIKMRSYQQKILAQIYTAMKKITYIPTQHEAVSAFFEKVAQDYRMDNDVADLLSVLEELMMHMRDQPLPVSREEFESRALLYYILRRLEDFLLLKRRFYQDHHVKQ